MGQAIGDIQYVRGDTKPIIITVINKTTGKAVDVTGCSFKFTVDPSLDPIGNTANLFQLDGVVDADQVNNKGKVAFNPTVDDTNHFGSYYYDIQMIDTNLKKDTFVRGYKFIFLSDITK